VNERPNGPCKDTCVDLDGVRRAIEWFLRAPPSDQPSAEGP